MKRVVAKTIGHAARCPTRNRNNAALSRRSASVAERSRLPKIETKHAVRQQARSAARIGRAQRRNSGKASAKPQDLPHVWVDIVKTNMVLSRPFWGFVLAPARKNAVCVNPIFRKVERGSVSLSLGLGAMKRSTVLYSACLGAFVGLGCSQEAPRAFDGLAGAPAAQAGSAPVATGGSGGAAPVGTGRLGSGGQRWRSRGWRLRPRRHGRCGGAPAAGGAGGAPASGGSTSAGAGGTTAGGAGGLSAADIVPGLNGYYWEGTCAGSIAVEGHNCPMSDSNPSCPTNGINREKTLMVKGTTGQLYTINIEVRGVIGTRCYTVARALRPRRSATAATTIGGTSAARTPTHWLVELV